MYSASVPAEMAYVLLAVGVGIAFHSYRRYSIRRDIRHYVRLHGGELLWVQIDFFESFVRSERPFEMSYRASDGIAHIVKGKINGFTVAFDSDHELR
jgi:hypothetical protein